MTDKELIEHINSNFCPTGWENLPDKQFELAAAMYAEACSRRFNRNIKIRDHGPGADMNHPWGFEFYIAEVETK